MPPAKGGGMEIFMIFLCFSVKDRVPLINDFYHFLSNFGLDIWYDRRNIFLGDNRFDTNITLGANNSDINYAIVFYSKNFAKGNICIQEYKVLEKRYQNNDLFIFPVFIENVPEYIESIVAQLSRQKSEIFIMN